MKLSLRVLTPGKQEGQVLDIKLSQFLVGRDPQCHLRPASPLISKRHCALIQRDGKVFIRDFDSTNGTHVNDEPVKGERELHHDDRQKIGPLLFGVQIEAGSPVGHKTPAPPTKAAAKTPPPPTKNAPRAVAKPAPKPADQPAPAAPAPAAASSGSDEDDIAALLMSMQDDTDTSTPSLLGSEAVPDGSTVLEIKLPPELGGPPAEAKDKGKDKPKPSGNTSSAAASILEKMMKRPRS
jgi:predicted component of type VI protein secretion system